mgnify:CR=1 FL=1
MPVGKCSLQDSHRHTGLDLKGNLAKGTILDRDFGFMLELSLGIIGADGAIEEFPFGIAFIRSGELEEETAVRIRLFVRV